MVPAGIILLACGTSGLIVNVILWLEAWRNGSMAQRLTRRRRLLVSSSLLAVLVGTALVWTGMMGEGSEALGLASSSRGVSL